MSYADCCSSQYGNLGGRPSGGGWDQGDTDGFTRLLEERGATEAWQRFRTEETRTALQRWCDEHGLRLVDDM